MRYARANQTAARHVIATNANRVFAETVCPLVRPPDHRRRARHPIPVGDAQKASQKAKDKHLDKMMKVRLANQIGASESLSARTKRRRRDGFMLG